MKPRIKTTILTITILAICVVVFLGIRNSRECCLCSNKGRSLCLFDLKTGEFMALNFDGPTDTYVSIPNAAESNVDTFSLIRFGNVSGNKQTLPGVIELEVPAETVAGRLALCYTCKKLLPQEYESQYALAYLGDNDINVIFPPNTENKINIPGYIITVTSDVDAYHITIKTE